MARTPRATLVATVLIVAACGPVPPSADDAIDVFVEAVQAQDLAALYCRMAGIAGSSELGATAEERRAAFAEWALSQYAAYETGRDAGRVELDGRGIGLVKLLALGRGTFYQLGLVREPEPDIRLADAEVRFGYAHVDLSGFSPGTTFYVAGEPIGRVHAVTVPETSREIEVEVLDSLDLVWTLAREPAEDGCPERWAVAGVEPVQGSATTTDVTWVF